MVITIDPRSKRSRVRISPGCSHYGIAGQLEQLGSKSFEKLNGAGNIDRLNDDETNFVTKLILPEYNCRKIVKVKMTKIIESGANMSTWKQLSEYLKSCIKI